MDLLVGDPTGRDGKRPKGNLMQEHQNPGKLPPLWFGRLSRVVFGVATLVGAVALSSGGLGSIPLIGLVFLGLSFLVGGLMGNPGCELSALPNLVLPSDKRVHFP